MSHLWDVVLCSLRGGERHRRHGHHDWLVGWVDGCRGSLRAWPYGGSVGGHGGPRRLHLSPLEKLEATREKKKKKKNSKRYISLKKEKKKRKRAFTMTQPRRCRFQTLRHSVSTSRERFDFGKMKTESSIARLRYFFFCQRCQTPNQKRRSRRAR